MILDTKCAHCGQPMNSGWRGRKRYCSPSCVWAATKGPEFNKALSIRTAEQRGETLRGRGNGCTYRKRNGRHEHRIVAEKILGRPLQDGEVVHHLDGGRLNNAPENLEVTTQAEHMKRHGLGLPGVTPPWRPWEKRHGHT